MSESPIFTASMRYSAFIFALMFLFQGKNVSAQAGFDTLLNYGQIKQMIASGVAAKDLKKQAFGWYHFAYYTERQYGDSDSAFQYLVRSMYRFKKNGDTLEYQRVRSDMAEWLSRRNLVNQAISMQSQALYYAQKHGALGLRVRILARMSRYYLMKGDTVNALQYRRLFRLANELQKDTALEVSVLLEEVKRLHYEGRNTAAALLSARTLELARRLPQTELLAQSLYNSGALACDDRRYTEALKFLKEAEKLPVGPFNPQRRLILRQLSTTYAGLDSLNTALKYAFKYAELSDSILYRNRDTAAQRIVMQFDTLETSKTISLLKREKNAIQSFSENLFLVLEVLFFLILIAGLAFYLYRRDNLKQKLITRQQEEIKTRKIRELEDALKIETMQSML
ncbi:MAG: hypothetical protein KGS48_07640, partial [Bacteroidetes bacterium]|nr:hypothetical protein [Bacteroidota bacterium]